MIKLLLLAATSTILVNTDEIYSDFASSICQERYELDQSVVCQPNGDYAAKQCPLTADTCYCVTEAGIMIDGTRYNRNKGYVCQNVKYTVQYKYELQDSGFNVTDMLYSNNELTRKLSAEDRRHGLWEIKNTMIGRDQRDHEYKIITATIRGYNTRLTENVIVRKVKSVLGVDSPRKTKYLELVKTYDSVHEGQCPALGECDERARICLSDSECQTREICCQTECEYRCISVTQVSGTTSEPTEMLSSTPGTPTLDGSVKPTQSWYSTSPDPSQRTEALGVSSEASETWGTGFWTTEPITSYDFSTTDPGDDEQPTSTEPALSSSYSEPRTDPVTTPAQSTSTTMTDFTTTVSEDRTTEGVIIVFETKTRPSWSSEQTTTLPLGTNSPAEQTSTGFETRSTQFEFETLSTQDSRTSSGPQTESSTFYIGTVSDERTQYTTTFVNSLPTESRQPSDTSTIPIHPIDPTIPIDTTESETPPFSSSASSTPPIDHSESKTLPLESFGTDDDFISWPRTNSEVFSTGDRTATDDRGLFTSISTTSRFDTDSTGFGSSESSTLESSYATTLPLTSSDSDTWTYSHRTIPITYFTDEMTGGTGTTGMTEPIEISGKTIELDLLSSSTRPTRTPQLETEQTRPLSTDGATTNGAATRPDTTLTTSDSLLSLCEREGYFATQEGRQGPMCLDNGDYDPQQCDLARSICWCVDEIGLEIKGSMRYGAAGPCENFKAEQTTAPYTTTVPLGDCWKAYQRAVKQQAYDRNVLLPACQTNGLYLQSQCQGTYCWCVDEITGQMVNGTRKPGPIDCDIYLSGVCPEFAREHGTCINKCDNDEYCYGTTKCCQTQCGRDCVYPQLPEQLKEGLCPTPDSMNTIFERCTVDCSNDEQCAGDTKCCFNGCGYTCSEAIYDMNIYCKKIDVLYKGKVVDPRDQYSDGDVLQLQCNHGYELQGSEEIRCLATGEWETELPLCKRINCGMPGSGQFVIIRGNDYWVGGVVTYHCYSGYELIGNSSATCLVSGRWDSQPPACERRECPDSNELRYGRVYGTIRTYGNRIGFRCDYGYTLIGSEQRLCLSDGTWSGTDPRCVRGYFSRTRRHKPFLEYEDESTDTQTDTYVHTDRCQYEAVDTIDYNGDCVEDIWTIDCQCGEPNTIEQTVKVLCQKGNYEFIERTVQIGTDCSCCQQANSDLLP